MGRNNRQKKSGFSLFNMFKSGRSKGLEDTWDDNIGSGRRIWPSDEDKGSWVAEPGIDRKASDFIAKFHAIRVSESEVHYQPAAAGKP